MSLSVVNNESLSMIIEERVSMNKCCNLKCSKILPAEQVMKIVSRKFNILKKGTIQENTNPKVFCGKIKLSDISECEDAYKLQERSVVEESDGGIFSQTFESIVLMLENYCLREQRPGTPKLFLD
jgi:Rtr1/RPAP2 family